MCHRRFMYRGTPRERTIWSHVFAAIALIAIAAHALLPPGYMLSAAQQPGQLISVTLCSGHGGAPLLLDLSTGDYIPADQAPNDGGSKSDDGAQCIFAAASGWAPPPSVISPPAAPAPMRATSPPFTDTAPFFGRQLAAPPPWATGPPRA